MQLVEIEGNTLRLKSRGPGGIEGAGAGEMQLWSMLSAMGPMKPEDAESWMAGFIPKTSEDE